MSQSKFIATLLIVVAFILRLALPQTAFISFIVLAGYSLLGVRQAILAMFFSWLFVMVNPGIAPSDGAVTSGKYIVFFAASLSVFFRSNFVKNFARQNCLKVDRRIFFVSLPILIVALHSVIISPYKLLSFLKVFLFGLVFLTLTAAWSKLSFQERDKMLNDILYLLLIVFFLSFAFVNSPVGYLTNGSGFQGLLNQPQVFGVTAAIASTWVFSKVLMEKRNFLWWAIFIFLLISIFLSESRTAGVAALLAITISFIVYFLVGISRHKLAFRGAWSIGSLSTILGVFLVLSINITTISAQIDEYFTKGGRDGNIESLGQGYEMSRSFLIARMFSNIEEHPFVGIGFGVSSTPEEMNITYDPIFGAPLSAPVEKGVLPVAIIEEFGFFLGGAIFALLGLILYFGFKLGPESFSLIIVFYLLNLGEAMLFSPGGMGMLLLILLSSVVARGWNGQRI